MKRITLCLQSPYVGLRPFSEQDAVLFFGRDQHVQELVPKLEGKQRFLAVLGASGTGKSSLVRAGLIPALHCGPLTSPGYDWTVCTFTPGDAPLTNLALALTEHEIWRDSGDRADAVSSLSAALARSPLALAELYRQKADVLAGQALLLVVDQFEEIFRYRQKNVDEAEAFINLLLRSASEDVPIYVVMTMRSDFLGNCVSFFGLPEAINRGIYLTPRLGPDQLKSIIASPLALVGGEIDLVLVSKLVNTLGGEDELPIMEHAMLRMWNRARAAGRASIEMEDFEAVCALHSERIGQAMLAYTIDNHATEIYDTLLPHQQVIARQVFLSLVERRDGREVRRPQRVKQLVELVGEQERANLLTIIEAFRAEEVGFLLPAVATGLEDDRTIDISHESLFRQWRLLRKWLDEEEGDVAELREWQQRTASQKKGGGWLDIYDCERAQRWLARITERADPAQWTMRYGGLVTYGAVKQYIEKSFARVIQIKAEQERLEREAKEAETRRLELEAQVQREAAERAEGDLVRAEKEKRQAEEHAAVSRRQTRIAIGIGAIAVVLFMVAAIAAWWANQEKTRAEAMARDAASGELAAEAENLTNDYPDQRALLILRAWQISPIAKAQALIRATVTDYALQTVLRGHESAVKNAQLSPDGKTVITASSDRTARLWDMASGKELHVLRGHEDVVTSAQFAPNGRQVVTASEDKTARLWEVTSGKELHVLHGHEEAVESVQFSPDGKTVVTASRDKTARLWDVVSGKELHVLRGHRNTVFIAQFAPNGKTVVTTSEDTTARLWEVARGKELHVLRGHETAVRSAQFAPDGETVVTASDSGTARLWETASGKCIRILAGYGDALSSAEFSPDGKVVVTASKDRTAQLWDVASGGKLHVLRGHEMGLKSAQFSPDGKTVITASEDQTARLWDVASGNVLHVLRGHEGGVSSAQFAPDGKTVVTVSRDKTARLWDIANGRVPQVLRGHEKALSGAQFARDGKMVVTASEDTTARLWDVARGKEFRILRGHEMEVKSAQFSPDGKTVITASSDRTARIWEVTSGRELHVLRGHEEWVSSAQFSPDGMMVVAASFDKTARLWDVPSGNVLHVLRGHETVVTSAQFSLDGKMVVTASNDRTARLWDVASGRELQVLRGHGNALSSAQFSPDGRTLVTASDDKTARLWDVESGKELHILRHEGGVSSAQFSSDGKMVVTASNDRTARLWRCDACGPIDELAGKLEKAIGRDLTDEERRRYGVPDEAHLTRN